MDVEFTRAGVLHACAAGGRTLVIIHDDVVDVAAFLRHHPGGESVSGAAT